MKRMTKMKSVLACVCAVLMIALAVVPMFTLSASAADETATLSFANKAQRTSFSTTKQVWQQNGVVFTNNKASSTNNVADYANPVRLYAKSSIVVETALGDMTKIEFTCSSSSYASALKNSISGSTVSGSKVTVTLSTPASTFTVSSLTAQVRMSSITIHYQKAASACEHTSTSENITLEPTCTKEGQKSIVCDDCGNVIDSVIIPKLDHSFVDGVCSVCNTRDDYSGTYYIATKRTSGGNYFYMTNDLGSAGTKRYQAVDSKLTVLPETITAPDSAYVFTVEKRDNGYVISTVVSGTVKYITWSSGNSGELDTEAKAKVVDIQPNGDNAVRITIENGSRNLALNDTSGNNYFAWYESAQANKLALIPVVQKEEVNPEIKSAALNIGDDLTMNYRVVLPEGADTTKYSMTFTLNEKTVTVTSCKAVEDGYVFAFEGIAPQLMGDTIVAKLLCDGAEVATVDYSVKQYVVDTMKGASDKLVTLLSDLLAYGAAAQTYRNYKTNDLVNVNVDGYAPSSATPVLADKVTALTENTSDVASLTAVGVYFDYTNKIYVKLNASTLEGVVVKVNGTAVNVEAYGNGYIAYSDAVSALDFGTAFTVTLEVDGEVAQTLTYSINSYVYTKCENADAELTAMQSLALALYRYGASALAYKA